MKINRLKQKSLQIVVIFISALLLTACATGSEEVVKAENTSVLKENKTELTEESSVPVKKEPLAESNRVESKASVNTNETESNRSESSETDTETEALQQEEQQFFELGPETLGNPRSSYGLGSAPFLKGNNILVSMFVTTPESNWTEAEKKEMLDKIGVAADYIEEKATDYHTETLLYYDYLQYPSLYREAVVDFCINEDTDFMDRLDEEIALWFEREIDYDELLSEFDGDGIATMVLVDNPGISYAIVYDGTDNVKESLVLFSGDYYNNGRDEKPITYAHEILHLFGAHDLYEDAEFTSEVTEYVKNTYPEEIMLTVTGSGNTYASIAAELSPITAYHLGWITETEEIEWFPQLQRE